MPSSRIFTNATGTPVVDNTNIQTAGPRGPALLQDIWLIEKLAHFDREVIPERRMHAKGWGAYGTFTVTARYHALHRAKLFIRARQADADVRCASPPWPVSAARPMPSAISAARA